MTLVNFDIKSTGFFRAGAGLKRERVEQELSRRERKKLETRQGLLEAAQILFREKGYSATTVEEITSRADVAKGTFFNYFPSKETLLGELAVWHIGQLRAALDVNAGAPVSPVARLKRLMRLLHEHTTPDVALVRQIFAHRLCYPPSSSQSLPPHQAKRRLFGLLTELVLEAQACGELRADADAELVSDLLRMSFFRQFIVHGCTDRAAAPIDHLEQIVDLLMDGLAGPNWRKV